MDNGASNFLSFFFAIFNPITKYVYVSIQCHWNNFEKPLDEWSDDEWKKKRKEKAMRWNERKEKQPQRKSNFR